MRKGPNAFIFYRFRYDQQAALSQSTKVRVGIRKLQRLGMSLLIGMNILIALVSNIRLF